MVVRTESETAFAALYEANAARVLAYCVRRMPREDARDAAAEVFAVAWRRFDDVPSGEASLRWLYGVAANVVKNHRRSRRRAGNLTTRLKNLGSESTAGPEMQMIRRHEHDAVRQAIGRLRHRYREALQLVEWEGLSRTEAAELLHISRAAVDQRLHRAYRRLENELSESVRGGRP